MGLDELNFTEICRCCKRTKSEMISMISIFDANADLTYPPVDEMIISIASLKVQENDGLPSLVCTLCLKNIQDAFTFILQITLINTELSQMFARRKQADTLQDTYGICESVKIEEDEYESDQAGAADSEDVKLSLKVEDESMQNDYQHRSADNSDENIDVVVQAEGVLVPSEFEGANDMGVDEDYQQDVQDSISVDSSDSEYTRHGSRKTTQKCSDLMAGSSQKSRVQEKNKTNAEKQQSNVDNVDSSDDASNQGAAETYEEDDEGKEGNITGRSQKSRVKEKKKTETERQQSNVEDEDEPMDDDDSLVGAAKRVDDEEIDEICPKSPKRGNLTAKIHAVYKCNLCPYSSAVPYMVKRHLQVHCKEPFTFTCSKCNGTFASKYYMLHHERKCNGKISKYSHGERRAVNRGVISLQDLDDPLIINKYYTVTDVCVQDINNGDVTDVTVQRPKDRRGRKSSATSAITIPRPNKEDIQKYYSESEMDDEEISLQLRTKRRKMTLRSSNRTDAPDKEKEPSPLISMTLQNQKDVEKLKKSNSYIGNEHLSVNDGSKFTVFKCNLCRYTCNCISYLNRHLRSHSKQKRFTCSNCKGTFARKYNMMQHRRNCNGKKRRKRRKDELDHVIPFQDLKDPLKLKKYFTVTKIDVQNNNGENVKVQRPKGGREEVEIKQISSKSRRNQRTSTSKITLFKCKLCAYTSTTLTNLKKHLGTHCKVKPFQCSKCNRAFSHTWILWYHEQNCNGRSCFERQVIPLQDLKDPLKINMYYTRTDIDI